MTRYVMQTPRRWAAVAAALLMAMPALASAQNVLSVPDTMASAGDASVAIPVDYTGPDLTTLTFNVNFDPAFCAMLADPSAITIVTSTAKACTSDCSNGGTSCTVAGDCSACTSGGCQMRTKAQRLEQTITCASGTMRIAFDTGTGSIVIGKGQGEILEINVGALTANASGMFTFTPASIDAHNGPLTITISPTPGTLTIVGPTTTTSTSTTSTTGPTTTSPSTTTTSSSTTTTIPGGTCPVGPGFWRKHPSAWPVTTLVLGSQTYTQSELLAVLRARRSRADASLLLARQLIAAKLNVANGSDPTTIGTTVADADRLLAMFGGRLPYGVPRSSALGRSMVSDRHGLDRYNTGRDTPTCVRERERG